MKRFLSLLAGAAVALGAMAAIPNGYYDSLEGKSGTALRNAVKNVARNHKVVSYGDDTWEAFKKTDVKMVNGREAWWDMYSNEIVYVSTGHGGMNIEHSVANSWWNGTKNDAYKDLMHLNPSNATANNRKSNYPLSEIQSVTWDNGVTFIGTPVSGQGGGAKYVYEPADQYKGDFARAFMYVFTIYDDIAWKADWDWMYDSSEPLLLRSWASELLLKWSANDPADEKELARNEAIYGIQNNRNPFIDIPGLGEYIWGSRKNDEFHLSEAGKPSQAPAAPQFTGFNRVTDTEYSGTWWAPLTIQITAAEGEIEYALDGGAYQPYLTPGVQLGQGTEGEKHLIKAVAVKSVDGEEFRSREVTLSLTARDPQSVVPEPIGDGEWVLVTEDSQLSESAKYVIVASEAKMAMSYEAGDSKKYMESTTDNVKIADGRITQLPSGTGIVTMKQSGSGWKLCVADTEGNVSGWLNSTSAKDLNLVENDDAAAAATITIGSETSISYGSAGKLLYNVSAPRFTTYTSAQQGVQLYMQVAVETPEAPEAPEFYAVDELGNEITDGYFVDTACVELLKNDLQSEVYYTLNGEIPVPGTPETILYDEPIDLYQTTTVTAIARRNGIDSAVARATFTKRAVDGIHAVDSPDRVIVADRSIEAPEGSKIYDCRGMECGGRDLAPGLYIVRTRIGAVKVIIR